MSNEFLKGTDSDWKAKIDREMVTLLSSQRGLEQSDRATRKLIDELFAIINGDHKNGEDGMHTRLRLVENKINEHRSAVLGDHNKSLKSLVDSIDHDLSALKIRLGEVKEAKDAKVQTGIARLTFWATVIGAWLAFIGTVVINMDKVEIAWDHFSHKDPRSYEEQLADEIAIAKKGPRAKVVRNKLKAIEKESREMRE